MNQASNSTRTGLPFITGAKPRTKDNAMVNLLRLPLTGTSSLSEFPFVFELMYNHI